MQVSSSVCPKCGKVGTSNVFRPKKNKPELRYLRFIHRGQSVPCFIGRLRTTDEVMGEFNEPQSIEEYKKVVKEIVKYANSLATRRSRLYGHVVKNEIRDILLKYGLWI